MPTINTDQPEPVRQVASEVLALLEEVAALSNALERLEKRLAPVVHDPVEKPKDIPAAPPTQILVAHAAQLHAQMSEVRALRERVRDLTDRLEI